MKKRGALAVLAMLALSLFIALMPEAFSIYGEKVYSGSVEEGKTVDIKGIPFTFIVDPVSSKVYVEFNSSAVIVPSFECKTKDYFNICAKNISFSRRISNESRDVYKADIEITLIKSKIEVSHSISKQNLLIDEEATAALKVENIADISAKDLVAVIEIPSNLFLGEVIGCKKLYSKVILADEITPTEIKTCSYKLTGLAAGDFELKPEIAYFDGVETVNATSAAVQGKVYNRSLKISQFLNKSRFDIGEKFNLTLNIKNTNDEHDLGISLMNLKLPEGLLLIKHPKEFSKNNNILTWSGTLAPKEADSFIMELQSYATGNYSILVESVYKESKFSRRLEDRLGIEVYCNCPAIQHELAPASFGDSQPVRLTAQLSNPNTAQDFSNVGISYKSSIPKIKSGSFNYGKISPLETINILDYSFPAPQPGQVYELNITAKFSSIKQPFILRDKIVIASLSSAAEAQQNQSKPDEISPLESQKAEEADESEEAEKSGSHPLKIGGKNEGKDAADVPEEAQEIVQEDVLELSSGSSFVKNYLLLMLLIALASVLAILTGAFILRKSESKGAKDMALHEKGINPSMIQSKPAKDKNLQISEEKDMHLSFKEMIGLMRGPSRSKAEIKTAGNAQKITAAGDKGEEEFKILEEEIKKLGNIFEKKKEGKKGIVKSIADSIKRWKEGRLKKKIEHGKQKARQEEEKEKVNLALEQEKRSMQLERKRLEEEGGKRLEEERRKKEEETRKQRELENKRAEQERRKAWEERQREEKIKRQEFIRKQREEGAAKSEEGRKQSFIASIFKSVLGKKSIGKEKIDIVAKIKDKSAGFMECHRLLLKGEEALSKNDIEAAKSAYMKANSIYANLKHNEKKELYNRMAYLYNKLKAALYNRMTHLYNKLKAAKMR